jgi:hypothetical protein
MRYLFYVSLLFTLTASCNTKNQRGKITIGEYSFSFPNDFELLEGKGIDSYVGKIKGDSLWLGFDYGYYSNPIIEAPQEYLENGSWKLDAYIWFAKPDSSFTRDRTRQIDLLYSKPIKTKADSNRFNGADLIAVCKLDSISFEYGLKFPDEIKVHDFVVDTIKDHYRKIVIARDPMNGRTGMFLRSLNGFNESVNSCLALSIGTSGLTKHQQDSIVKIFLNVKIKSNN